MCRVHEDLDGMEMVMRLLNVKRCDVAYASVLLVKDVKSFYFVSSKLTNDNAQHRTGSWEILTGS